MKNQEKKRKSIRGVTLPALITTVIVMLILAGISISMMSDSGILGRAGKAADSYEISDEQDVISVAFATAFNKAMLTDGEVTIAALQAELDKTGRKTVVSKDVDDDNKLNVLFDKTQNEHSVDIITGIIDFNGPYPIVDPPPTDPDIIAGKIKLTPSTTDWTNQDVIVTVRAEIPENLANSDKYIVEWMYSTEDPRKDWKELR